MKTPPLNAPLHFIGIGGSGMAPLAELCHGVGEKVQGSDLSPNKSTVKMVAQGIKIFDDHKKENLTGANSVVYSSAIKPENPEYAAARTRGMSLLHRSELLAQFVNHNTGIAVAGTHGKTTTSAMTAFMLDQLGVNPSAAVGGRMLNFDSSSLQGNGDLFVAEADESDGSLVKYRPFVGVLTNIAEDHLENLGDIATIKDLFATYLSNTHPDGCAVLGWDNPYCREIGLDYESDKLTYGFLIGSDVRAFEYRTDRGGAEFKAVVERDQVSCKLRLIGKHNIQNALAALAVARALELDVAKAAACLAEFKGVARRTSVVYDSDELTILDDYAHNPDKIHASVTSVRAAYPDRELYVIFQPHRFSRLQRMFEPLTASFTGADKVVVVPTFAAGEPTLDEFSTRRVADSIEKFSSVAALAADDFAHATDDLVKALNRPAPKKPAIILTVGAGDVWQCGPLIRDRMNGKGEESTP